ncbi:hypothetical protein MT325_m551L [Paramecium bursaria chlorella virus MT325]|uniref:Uncharacterized protein m551L n=1 Tax=Paramecium bursaria Chlorella virus MT325 TaxID=346932 RepID=A7IUT1_PBCVM|nr:hypothetical protein MT325_m551L [Paramecium bursaria chlorella virus MT325]
MMSRGSAYFLILPSGSKACMLVVRMAFSSFRILRSGSPGKSISKRTFFSVCFSRKSTMTFFSTSPSRKSL